MAARTPRIVWTETTLRRLAAGRADAVTSTELAQRFGVTKTTVDRKLAEAHTLVDELAFGLKLPRDGCHRGGWRG